MVILLWRAFYRVCDPAGKLGQRCGSSAFSIFTPRVIGTFCVNNLSEIVYMRFRLATLVRTLPFEKLGRFLCGTLGGWSIARDRRDAGVRRRSLLRTFLRGADVAVRVRIRVVIPQHAGHLRRRQGEGGGWGEFHVGQGSLQESAGAGRGDFAAVGAPVRGIVNDERDDQLGIFIRGGGDEA